jgi:hypothetical protein
MRRVSCSQCGVVVEYVLWGDGKHQLTQSYSLVLARWARKLSWKETALSFYTIWTRSATPCRALRRSNRVIFKLSAELKRRAQILGNIRPFSRSPETAHLMEDPRISNSPHPTL